MNTVRIMVCDSASASFTTLLRLPSLSKDVEKARFEPPARDLPASLLRAFCPQFVARSSPYGGPRPDQIA